ncbi:protein kinase, putative [Theileria annulata]|uniref:Serine/threonine-protein kinase RIO1 n=1 Tax=Theileria annulata TaxID=5874 RepID=Q4UI72_THEAN|nr:protein kinase, putative [Theileria annulata]CAI73217.1 protein kinase, putative [Theileria annulata]|eukprot:XP_953894.1 protein kinase, putative [Theileria annulata]
MSTEESYFSSESDPDSEEDIADSEENTSGILFFKRSPNDESRLARNSIIYKRNSLEKGLTKDKRVTVQQVLDKRTYIRLKRLHGRGIFDFIYGVISTGKEANVYEAEGTLLSTKHRIAIKVYKTSILIFKDRSRYIEGEFRFRRSYVGTKNPRKMVSQWAEKEFRNLRRISLSGIYCPCPIALKDHILVMELIHDSNGRIGTKLKDLGQLPVSEWLLIYSQVISIMRILYQESKLIHADFSSYNLLYSESRVVVIDVSQAVENDHPNSMYFLKRDCENITTFFTTVSFDNPNEEDSDFSIDCDHSDSVLQNSFNILTSFQLFNFITMELDLGNELRVESLDENVDEYVNKMVYTSKNAKVDHLREVIMKKRLLYNAFYNHVYNLLLIKDPIIFIKEPFESVNFISNQASWSSLNHLNLSSLTVDILDRLERENNLPEPNKTNYGNEDSLFEDNLDSNSSSDQDVESPEDNVKFNGKIPEGIDPKEWKRMVKQMNRERREHKIPKHIKKSFKNKHS